LGQEKVQSPEGKLILGQRGGPPMTSTYWNRTKKRPKTRGVFRKLFPEKIWDKRDFEDNHGLLSCGKKPSINRVYKTRGKRETRRPRAGKRNDDRISEKRTYIRLSGFKRASQRGKSRGKGLIKGKKHQDEALPER